MMKNWGLILISIFVLSCLKNDRYDSAHTMHNEKWNAEDTAYFAVNITDTSRRYNMYMTLRRSINYPYSNIWLRTLTQTPDTTQPTTSDLELTLEEKDGKPTGSRFGNNIEHVILIREGVKLRYGTYKFWILQNMRDESLQGILNIGVRLERT